MIGISQVRTQFLTLSCMRACACALQIDTTFFWIKFALDRHVGLGVSASLCARCVTCLSTCLCMSLNGVREDVSLCVSARLCLCMCLCPSCVSACLYLCECQCGNLSQHDLLVVTAPPLMPFRRVFLCLSPLLSTSSLQTCNQSYIA